MTLSPRVTVILPTHNRPKLLAEAAQSIAEQSMDTWNAVIVDDGSNPGVAQDAIPDGFEEKFTILRHSTPKGGPSAKNTGLSTANTEYVAFLDDDDLLAPTYLERAVAVLDKHPDIDVVFMGVSWFGVKSEWARNTYDESMRKTLDEAKGKEIEPDLFVFDDELFGALLNRVPMAFQRPVARRQALDRIGLYGPDCLLWDCDWAYRAALHANTALLNVPLYRQRVEDQGYSSRRDRQLEHLLSSVEIRESLLGDFLSVGNKAKITLLKEAAATTWFDIAYYYRSKGDKTNALKAWWRSQHYKPNINRVKFLVRLLLIRNTKTDDQ